MELVDRVLQVEPPQERIRGDLRGSQDVASASGFDLGKREKLAHPSVVIAPDPAVNRPQKSIDTRRLAFAHGRAQKHIAFPVGVLHRRAAARGTWFDAAGKISDGRMEARRLILREFESATRARKFCALSIAVELVVASIGLGLMICALGANRVWLDRHVLPSFLLPRDWFVAFQTTARILLGVTGGWLMFVVRPTVGRVARRTPARIWSLALAAILAIAVSEPALRRIQFRPVEWLSPDDEPLRRGDARLGWTLVRSRTGHVAVGGRTVDYAVDAHGYRVRRVDEPVDPQRPTVVFTGESVMFGEGLTWEESIPARVGALTGRQSANLAVHGYGSDQAFLALQADLPRFQRPVAVVSLFMTTLFGRNLDRERPHLMPGLVWRPPVTRWRLESLARLLVPYRSDGLIDQGVAMTRQVLLATATLARSRGAMPLVVVPQFGWEADPEQRLRRRIFDGAGLDVEFVPIDPAWRLRWDRHPDARAARAIALAIARRMTSVNAPWGPPSSWPSPPAPLRPSRSRP